MAQISTAVQNGTVARIVGIDFPFVDLRGNRVRTLPQHVALIGQGATTKQASYDTTPATYRSASAIGAKFGFGSPLHLAAKQLFPRAGNGVGIIPVTVFPLKDDGSGVAADGKIVWDGTQDVQGAYVVRIAGIPTADIVAAASTAIEARCDLLVAAINAVADMPVIASKSGAGDDAECVLTAKWDGVTGNDISIAVDLTRANGAASTFTVTAMQNGAADPDIDTALDQFGETWYTVAINLLSPVAATLDKIRTLNDARKTATFRRRFVAISGSRESSVSTATTLPTARKETDDTNSIVYVPGSVQPGFVIAAAAATAVAKRANEDPAHDYGSTQLPGLIAPAAADQWDHVTRQTAVLGGASTVRVADGVVLLSDVITFHNPTDEDVPAYRFVVDIMKLNALSFNFDLVFATPEWDGAPLVPDGQPVSNPRAKSPAMAKAAVAAIFEGAGLAAWISDPATAIASLQAEIDSQNPKRLNVSSTFTLSGNVNVQSHTHEWGFYYGDA